MLKKLLFIVGVVLLSTPLFANDGNTPDDAKVIATLSEANGEAFVFNKADSKIYALNNLGQYEPYGVYEKVTTLALSSGDGEVGYVASSDKASYFNTDHTPTTTTRVVAEIINPVPYNGDWQAIFGTAATGGHFFTYEYDCGYGNGDMRIGTKCYGSDNRKYGTAAFKQRRNFVELDAATGKMTIYAEDGTSILEQRMGEVVTNEQAATCPLYIFAEDYNNGPRDYCKEAKLYGLKIYEGSTLVKDYVPYVQGGQAGLFDKEANAFLAPTGTGIYAGTITAYEGKIVRYDKDNHAYRYSNGSWSDIGAMSFEEISNTDYKDLNNWETNSAHAAIFNNGKIQSANGVNDIPSYIGTGGYEPLMTKVTVQTGEDYNFSFKYTNYSLNQSHGFGNWQPRAAVWTDWNLSTDNNFAFIDPNAPLSYFTVTDAPISLDFTPSQSDMTLVLQFGFFNDGEEYSFKFSDLKVQKYVYPETYPDISLTSAIELLLEVAEEWTQPMTTDNYWTELSAAKADAETYKADADITKQKEVLDALQTALDHVNAVGDITYLRPTIALAGNEGIDVAAATQFCIDGTTSGVPMLNALRVARQIKAKGSHTTFTGSEPTVGETYYLYNVGQGLFLCPSLVGSHELALGFAGDPLTLESNTAGGYQLKGTIRADGYIGHQWGTQGFFDGAANVATSSWYFFPVEGTTNVYNISKADNTNNGNLLGYAPESTPTYGIGESDGSQDWGMRVLHNRSGVDDAKNQWIFVTKDERDALLETATAANGVDATYYIVDPAIDNAHALQSAWQASEGNLDVWGDWISYAPADANFWIGNEGVSISQELTGLKPGIYSVGVQAVYMHPSDFSLSNAELFATNGAGETKTQAIAARIAGLDQVPGMGVQKTQGWMAATNRFINYWSGDGANGAAYYFHYGQYWNEVANVVVGEDGTLTIGVKKNAAVDNDVFVADNFRLTYYGPEFIPVTIYSAATDGDYNYTTLYYSDKNLAAPEGVKAYTATVSGTEVVLAEVDGAIPAGTGVVLKTDSKLDDNTTFNFSVSRTAGTAASDNQLRGTDEAETITGDGKYYMLSLNGAKEENSIGFYWDTESNEGTQLKNGAHKAYLAVLADVAEAKGYPFGGDATGIEGLNVGDSEKTNEIYDLQGRKLSGKNLPKGIYIVNGKKIVKR